MNLMHPAFSPTAAAASLVATLISIAVVVTTDMTPLHALLDASHPDLANEIGAVAAIIVSLGAIHLSAARSLLPSVDGTKEITAPTSATIEVK